MSPQIDSNDFNDLNDLNELKCYVVQSKPRKEERAFHFLKEKGLQTY